MNYTKELLLFVATTIVAAGAVLIQADPFRGTLLLLAGAVVFVGRGFYKKYFGSDE